MVAIKSTTPKKACNLCGNRIRGKAFAYYDEMPNLNRATRECIPMCRGCDSLISIYEETFALWYGLFRIASIRKLRIEERKKKQKRKK